MKRLKTGIGCLIFTVFFLFSWQSQAQISYVYDQADLLSEEQEQNLQEWAEKKKEAEKQTDRIQRLFAFSQNSFWL